jgi:hypothetical protein
MSKIIGEVVAANEAYVRGFGRKGELPLPPARRFAILTCMDARLDPAKYAGLAEGDMSSATRATVQPTTPSGRLSFPTSSSARRNGLSFITRIAAWSFSPTT